jgi:hypothetical protein
MRSTAVVLRNAAGNPDGVSLAVSCAECGVMFEFARIQSSATVLVSPCRTELRLAIAERSPHRAVDAALTRMQERSKADDLTPAEFDAMRDFGLV